MLGSGVVGTNLVNPSVSVGFQQTKTKSEWQTTAGNRISRDGGWIVKASKEVLIANGFNVDLKGSLEVTAPKLTISAAKLESSFDQQTKSISVGSDVMMSGTPTVNASYSRAHGEATSYQNAHINVGDTTKLNVGEVNLEGAVLNTNELVGKVDRLKITSLQNTSSSQSESMSIGSSTASFSKGSESSKELGERSGIYVNQAVSDSASVPEEKRFSVREIETTSADFHAEGGLQLNPESWKNTNLVDERSSSSMGISNIPINGDFSKQNIEAIKFDLAKSEYSVRFSSLFSASIKIVMFSFDSF